MSIQDRLAARSAQRTAALRRKAFEAAIADPARAPKAMGSVTAIYLLCIAYWVLTLAIVAACFAVWWWSDQTFTHVLFTVLGVSVLALSFPRRFPAPDDTWGTDDARLREYVDALCDAIDHGHPARIAFDLFWPSRWIPRGAGRSSVLVIGAALWAIQDGPARAASLVATLARDSANRSNFLVRATTSSLEEWLRFCNFDVARLTGTWQANVGWTTTLAGGAGVNDTAFARVNATLVAGVLHIIGLVPASIRAAIGHADLRLDLDAYIKGLRSASSTVGAAATVGAVLAAREFGAIDAAMQRHVLMGGTTPLDAGIAEAATLLTPTIELTEAQLATLRTQVPDDAYGVRYALVLARHNRLLRSRWAGAAPDIPADVTAQLDRELVGRYRNRYSFSR